MATATSTHIGPVGIDWMNNTFYVLDQTVAGFNTIQAAVDFVRTQHSGVGNIVICHGHGYAENIGSVTGGSIGIVIEDQRDGNFIAYRSSGGPYYPNDFVQYAAIITQSKIVSPALPGSTAMEYDPVNPAVNGHGQINVLSKPGTGMPFLSLVLTPQDGVTPAHALLQGSADAGGTLFVNFPEKVIIEPPDSLGTGSATLWMGQREIPGGKGMAVTAKPENNNIVFQGQTVGGGFDQDIFINPQGGNIALGANATVNEDGTIKALAGEFDDCTVDGSPVVTFENIGSVGGMVWPPVGVPVSIAGGAWGASISPDSLATYPGAGLAVSTGTAWGTPINPASLTPYPPAGIPLSTGTAWGTPINPATLATWPTAGIPVSTGTAWSTPINPATLATYPAAGVAVSTGTAWSTPINPATLAFTNTANTFTGNQAITGSLTVSGAVSSVGIFIAAGGHLRILDSALNQNTGTPNINTDGINLFFNATTGNNIFFNWSQGGGVIFGDGGGHNVGSIDALGNARFNGAITAGSKSFLIPHPLDDTKMLQHGSLEGPEFSVFYRGDDCTAGGWAEITLPDYFEALTMKENRSVLLTALFEEDDEPISTIAASRVKDGKFKVWSALPTQKFYWEVKAVRADIEPLVVAKDREIEIEYPKETEKDGQ